MPKYQVTIEGQNFLVERNGKIASHGFFAIRFLETADARAAENAAVDAIRRTETLRELVRNPPEDPPIMNVTEILELDSFDGIESLEPGFVWYEESTKRWWQFWKP
jgi:hypothetical protein